MRVTVGHTDFDGHTARVTVSVGTDEFAISLTSRTKLPKPAFWGDVWLPLALFPAMRTGNPLFLAESLSPGLARNLDTAQRVLSTFHSELKRIKVIAPPGRGRYRYEARRTKSMQSFTGGVDSFYTLASHPEVSTLVYVHDLINDTPAVIERITSLLDSVGRSTGKRVLHVESDVRVMLDRFGEWGSETHGAALSSIAAFVSQGSTDYYLPASHTYLEMYPWGSHPVLDRCWGSDERRVLHDGADATRSEKVKVIANDPVALQHLRVCWRTSTEINCASCEKCIRTMIGLELAGALSKAVTFTAPLTTDRIRSVSISSESDLSFAKDNLDVAIRQGRTEIVEALAEVVERYERSVNG